MSDYSRSGWEAIEDRIDNPAYTFSPWGYGSPAAAAAADEEDDDELPEEEAPHPVAPAPKGSVQTAYQNWAALPPGQREFPSAKVIAGFAGVKGAEKLNTSHLLQFERAWEIPDNTISYVRRKTSGPVSRTTLTSGANWPPPGWWTGQPPTVLAPEPQRPVVNKNTTPAQAYADWVNAPANLRPFPSAKVLAGFAGVTRVSELTDQFRQQFEQAMNLTPGTIAFERGTNYRVKATAQTSTTWPPPQWFQPAAPASAYYGQPSAPLLAPGTAQAANTSGYSSGQQVPNPTPYSPYSPYSPYPHQGYDSYGRGRGAPS